MLRQLQILIGAVVFMVVCHEIQKASAHSGLINSATQAPTPTQSANVAANETASPSPENKSSEIFDKNGKFLDSFTSAHSQSTPSETTSTGAAAMTTAEAVANETQQSKLAPGSDCYAARELSMPISDGIAGIHPGEQLKIVAVNGADIQVTFGDSVPFTVPADGVTLDPEKGLELTQQAIGSSITPPGQTQSDAYAKWQRESEEATRNLTNVQSTRKAILVARMRQAPQQPWGTSLDKPAYSSYQGQIDTEQAQAARLAHNQSYNNQELVRHEIGREAIEWETLNAQIAARKPKTEAEGTREDGINKHSLDELITFITKDAKLSSLITLLGEPNKIVPNLDGTNGPNGPVGVFDHYTWWFAIDENSKSSLGSTYDAPDGPLNLGSIIGVTVADVGDVKVIIGIRANDKQYWFPWCWATQDKDATQNAANIDLARQATEAARRGPPQQQGGWGTMLDIPAHP